MKRGLVISPRATFKGQFLDIETFFRPLDVRHYALYWDLLDWPPNQYVVIIPPDAEDLEFLQKEGLLARSNVSPPTGRYGVGDFALALQVEALRFRTSRVSNERWSLGQCGSVERLIVPEAVGDRSTTLAVELVSVLPVPSSKVRIEDVLAFKHRRAAELAAALWHAIDALCLSASQSEDQSLALLVTKTQLHQRLSDIERLLDESAYERVRRTVTCELRGIAAEAVSAGTVALAAGSSVGAAVAAAALPFVKSTVKSVLVPRGLPQELKAYAYVVNTIKELEPR